MSYSFSVLAADKAAAKVAVATKFDEMVVASQPVHAHDRAAVLANANAVIDLLPDDDTKDVSVSCNGYVSWSNPPSEEPAFNTAQVAAQASRVVRAPVV